MNKIVNSILDTYQLAFTKLKTRRLRLGLTVLVSSLLFSVLLGVAFTTSGTIKSIEKFRSSGFGDRFLVSSYLYDNSSLNSLKDPALISKAKELQKQLIIRKTAEAKRLNVYYDPTTETPYVNESEQMPGTKVEELNAQIPEVASLILESNKNKPSAGDEYTKTVNKYGATATYTSLSINNGSQSTNNTSITPLKNGKESFDLKTTGNGFNIGPGFDFNGLDSLSSQWSLMSSELMKPFILDEQKLEISADGSIPIVARYTAAQQILGLSSLPATASSKDQLNRLTEVRNKAAGYVFDICYRNQSSISLIEKAKQQQQEIESNKNNKNYRLPDLVYGLPTELCGPAIISRDVRSADQKTTDNNEAVFKKKFGEVDPESKIIKLRIVGINTDLSTGFGSLSVRQLFQSILVSSLGNGWFTPVESLTNAPVLTNIFHISGDNGYNNALLNRYAEFKSASDVEEIISKENCQPNFNFVSSPSNNNPYENCISEGKLFSFDSFGSSSVAIDHFRKSFDKVFSIVGIIISVIAAIILMGTVGRIISDSRRETAVFRAIGAKRINIAQIYITYTLMVGLLIALTSTVFGYLLSQFINGRYSQQVTVDALVAFNVKDLSQKFYMANLDFQAILIVSILMIGASLIASFIPLMTNLRRNPIKDMREDR